MTNISFHGNVGHTLNYVCRLTKKAWTQGISVLVVGEMPWLESLDDELWTFSDVDFIPHAFVGSDVEDVADEAVHVWLATHDQINTQAAHHAGFLIHCGLTKPDGFERFERLIEVVSTDELAKEQARKRWTYYKQRGYPLTYRDAKN